MSNQSKETIVKVKETFKKLAEQVSETSQKVSTLGDKELSKRIQKVQESTEQVIKHIEERSDGAI